MPNDSNWYHDVFVHDRQTGSTTRVSVASDGTQGGASSYEPCISADGRYVVFISASRALVPGDTNDKTDVFVHDRLSGQTTRANVDSHGAQANCWSYFPVMSSDGRFIAFESCAWNLASNDLDSDPDIFVHDRDSGQTVCASVAWNGSPGNGRSDHGLAISGDGRCVAFASTSSNLVPDDRNGTMDIFLRDMTIPTPTPTATSTPTATPTPTSTLTPTPTATPTTGTVYGEVWNDLDRDGEKEAGEPPLAGAQIRLKDSSHVLLAIWITQETGSYTFANLHPGAYYVNETDPPGYVSSTIGEVLVYLSANQSLQISFGDHALPTATATHTPTAMPAMLTVYLPVIWKLQLAASH